MYVSTLHSYSNLFYENLFGFIKRTFVFLSILLTLLLQGCAPLTVPIEHLIQAGDGGKDLSHDFKRGHVVGKTYETIQDLYLTKRHDSFLEIEESPRRPAYFDKNGIEKEFSPYDNVKPLPTGTRFKVCTVFASTSFGQETGTKKIFANLVDRNGNLIHTATFRGNLLLIEVTYLFESVFPDPNQNWSYDPKCKLIQEIDAISGQKIELELNVPSENQ